MLVLPLLVEHNKYMYTECPRAHEGCRWFDKEPRVPGAENGCFADTDHIVPQRLAAKGLARAFIQSRENKQQLCREEHEAKTADGDEPLPPRELMVESLRRQVGLGQVAMSRRLANIIGPRSSWPVE